jgi:hypothetical protein
MSAYTEISVGGFNVPLYLLQFDEHGVLISPEARAEVLAKVQNGDYRDVYLFSHGWNNDFDDSFDLFKRFFGGFMNTRSPDAAWRPVFIGVQWPSIALLFPWEEGPQIAGGGSPEFSARDEAFQSRAIKLIKDELSEEQGTRFSSLARKPQLDRNEALEMAQLARAALPGSAGEFPADHAPSDQELIAAAQNLDKSEGTASASGEFGFAREPGAGPAAAGLLDYLDPRNLIRSATVYMMKDRAGIIGAKAVRPLIEDLSSAGAGLRMIGHSYGARVVLAALATAQLPRKARSALLLQPAVNQYCFAESGKVPKHDGAGGFRRALDQVELPIYTTFSAKDVPLHDTFHIALRRSKDLGEAEIAAGAPPSIYCALGGYGPQGLSAASYAEAVIDQAGTYNYAATARVVALNGSMQRINGHSDVTNPYTFWALAEQDARTVN